MILVDGETRNRQGLRVCQRLIHHSSSSNALMQCGCAEISGLDDRKVLADFSTRAREIDQWQENNGLETRSTYQRIAQKITRQTKDLDVSLDELETESVRLFVCGGLVYK